MTACAPTSLSPHSPPKSTRFVEAQYRCWNDQLLPELRKQGIRLLEWEELDEDARAYAQAYFQREVDPLLTPIAIDPAHPFPRVSE